MDKRFLAPLGMTVLRVFVQTLYNKFTIYILKFALFIVGVILCPNWLLNNVFPAKVECLP